MEAGESTSILLDYTVKLNSFPMERTASLVFSKELNTALLDYQLLLTLKLMDLSHLLQEWDLNSLEMALIQQTWLPCFPLTDNQMTGTFSQMTLPTTFQQHQELH
jgi:hypothetical protein